jgi:hypothetical protein
MALSLRFEDNGTAHHDLVLRFTGERWVCDSYYLALDRGLLSEQQHAEKVRLDLRRLLQQWLAAVEQSLDGELAYMPYDFSDPYTGWLACHRFGDEVVVSRGWADVEGWAFFPSDIGDPFERPRGFHVDGPTLKSNMLKLLEAVCESMEEQDN